MEQVDPETRHSVPFRKDHISQNMIIVGKFTPRSSFAFWTASAFGRLNPAREDSLHFMENVGQERSHDAADLQVIHARKNSLEDGILTTCRKVRGIKGGRGPHGIRARGEPFHFGIFHPEANPGFRT
jgi:hypothetical protein